MDLLGWLVSVANRVYQWFGNEYSSLYNAARNAWNWATTLANNALNSARSYAYNLVQGVFDDINGLFDWVASQIDNLRRGVSEDIRGLFDWVQYQIDNLGSFNFDWVGDWINEVYQYIESVPGQIQNFIYNAVNETIDYIFQAFAWLNVVKNKILQWVTVFTNGFITNLLDLVNVWYPKFIAFFDDPVKFLYDLFQPSFLVFLNYIIAYALGTVKYDLPTKPDFSKKSLPK